VLRSVGLGRFSDVDCPEHRYVALVVDAREKRNGRFGAVRRLRDDSRGGAANVDGAQPEFFEDE
jgi:hypothetical protein